MSIKIVTQTAMTCSAGEFGAFVAFIRAGGEVSLQGLAERIREAPALAFAYLNGALVGISALKIPRSSYRSRVSAKCGVPLPAASLPFELGWVYVSPEARNQGISLLLSKAALAARGKSGTFATARTDNVHMHSSLIKLDFQPIGNAFISGRGKHSIQVFACNAAQPRAQAEVREKPRTPLS